MANAPKKEHSNAVVTHAQKSVKDIDNEFLSQVHVLQTSINRIIKNENFSDLQKQHHTRDIKINIERAFRRMEDTIRRERFAVAQEFRRIRTANPHVPLEQHPQLKALMEMKNNLQRLAADINTQHSLYKTSVQTIDPTIATLKATIVPTIKPVMDNKQETEFVNTAIKKGWSKSVDDMELYAKGRSVPLKDVKSQVVDALIDKRFEQVFERKARDMSKVPAPEESNTPAPKKPKM